MPINNDTHKFKFNNTLAQQETSKRTLTILFLGILSKLSWQQQPNMLPRMFIMSTSALRAFGLYTLIFVLADNWYLQLSALPSAWQHDHETQHNDQDDQKDWFHCMAHLHLLDHVVIVACKLHDASTGRLIANQISNGTDFLPTITICNNYCVRITVQNPRECKLCVRTSKSWWDMKVRELFIWMCEGPTDWKTCLSSASQRNA